MPSLGRSDRDAQLFEIAVDHVLRHVRVVGELDVATAPLLVESVAALQIQPATVTIDLHSATFLDAAALGAMVAIANRQRELASDLRVHGNPRVHRLFELGGLKSMLMG